MSKLRVPSFSISIDGYGAGPNQDLANPLGVGGLVLHQWFFATRTFQKMRGGGAGATGIDDDFAACGFSNIGAWILGRNMFGPIRVHGARRGRERDARGSDEERVAERAFSGEPHKHCGVHPRVFGSAPGLPRGRGPKIRSAVYSEFFPLRPKAAGASAPLGRLTNSVSR